MSLIYLLVTFIVFTPRSLLTGELKVSNEVLKALSQNGPILALESTIITHGLPYPTNAQTQLRLEEIAREQHVTPATIAVLEGVVTVGLSSAQIEQLAQSTSAMKSSSYDLQYAVAFNRTASTTVAATSRIAAKVGIDVFSTGAIGGVHRFADKFEFDVSADLTELARGDLIVVSAGCKAILDIKGTAEVLETNQVLTIGFNTSQMPAFYSRESGIDLDYKVENAAQAAQLYEAGIERKGFLLFNPIPVEAEIPREQIEPFILDAIYSIPKTTYGKQVTPYLLKKMAEITKSKSVTANLALIENNVRVGSQVAFEIKKLQGFCVCKNPVFFAMGILEFHEFKCVLQALAGLLIAFNAIGCICKSIHRKCPKA